MSSCPACATALDPGARFCSHCGTEVASAWDPSARGAPSQQAPPEASVAPGAPGPPASGLSERNWGVFAHLSALVPLVIGVPLTFLGPLVLWLMMRERGAFALDQAVEALNFNISWLLWSAVVVVLGAVSVVPTAGLGLIPVALVLVALALAWLILVIVAAVQTSNGVAYRYPLTVRFISA